MLFRIFFITVVFFSITVSASAQIADITVAVQAPPRTPVWRGAESFRDSVNRRLDNHAKVSLTIYNDDGILSAVRDGAIHMAVIRTDVLARTKTGEMSLFELPFFFQDLEEAVAIQNSIVGEALLGTLNLNGLVGLAYWNHGMNQLFGERSVAGSKDFKGLTVGTTGIPSAQSAAAALGVKMTYLPSKEAPMALMKGAVDLIESPAVFVSEGILPIGGPIYSRVNYRPSTLAVVANKNFWQSSTLRVQKALIEEARAASIIINIDAEKSDDLALSILKAKFKVVVPNRFGIDDLRKTSEAGWRKVEPLNRPAIGDRTFLDSAISVRNLFRQTKTTPKDQKLRKGQLNQKRSRVLFATDRRDDNDPEPELRFGGARGDLTWGEAMLTIDPNRGLGSGDTATIKLVDLSANRNRAAFVLTAKKRLEAAERKEALIYLHGYRTTFSQAIAGAAQIATDAKFAGIIGAFSWPSDGTTLSYFFDEEQVQGSRNNLQLFIDSLRKAGAERIHLVTHSMGARLAVDAIEWIASGHGNFNFRLHNAIFAAPDVRRSLFLSALPTIARQSQRITLYASKWDQALLCSMLLHKGARAGQGGAEIIVADMIDSVDASPVEEPSWLGRLPCTPFGHTYLHQNSAVLGDVYELLKYDAGPDRRQRLHRRSKQGLAFWLIQ